MDTRKKEELEARLADLKARWPPHSVPPSMWHELEEIEEELEKLKAGGGEERCQVRERCYTSISATRKSVKKGSVSQPWHVPVSC